MSDALEEHDGKFSIGGRTIINLRFTDDIDALAEKQQKQEALVKSVDKTYTRPQCYKTFFMLIQLSMTY